MMNRLHTKVLVYALLLVNTSWVMSMDEKSLTAWQVEARKNTAQLIASLKPNRITNPIKPINNFHEAKVFAGHVVLYEIVSKNKNRFSGDALSQYGFIFEKTHLHTFCFGYELNQFPNQDNPIELRFGFDGDLCTKNHHHRDHCFDFDSNNRPLLLSSAHIFMRHLTPQEAANFRKKIKLGDVRCDKTTRYSEAILARLRYRAQQEADEAPSLHVITKKTIKALSSLTSEQAEEYLRKIKRQDYFDYYVSDDERNYIENLLQSIVQ